MNFDRLVMCRPDNFTIAEAQNPFMMDGDELKTIDHEKAMAQWQALVDVLLGLEVNVDILEPTEGLVDQVFTANPVFCFPSPQGPAFFRANMRFDSRTPEVEALAGALKQDGVREVPLMGSAMCEGGGDLIWHNGRIWMGFGFRTDPSMLGAVRVATGARVTPLRLVDPKFYHLDTALAIIDDKAAIWIPEAFDEEARAELRAAFDLLIDATEDKDWMPANALSIDGDHIVIDGACTNTIQQLAEAGFTPVPVDTSEFQKAGGSVYCMKQIVY